MSNPASLVLARTPHPSTAAIATAIADAFLAAENWTSAALVTAGSSVLGLAAAGCRPS